MTDPCTTADELPREHDAEIAQIVQIVVGQEREEILHTMIAVSTRT